ncbi:hypothetical protein SISSUDRAFT_965602, partial [Sistotremastrum suecicum HHB10207 ss-3]
MKWSLRRGTRAAQKTPENVDENNRYMRRAFFRMAASIEMHDINQAGFLVNTDQTQVVYGMGPKLTWSQTGAKQVDVLGSEEKRAFTLVVGVSASGDALPFQAIFAGKTTESQPSKKARSRTEADEHGFKFESGGKTYWSTQESMRKYVIDILVPYFERQRCLHNRLTQKCMWLIDCWSVHRSQEFRDWMRENYPWIIIMYVPAGCTGL